MRKPFRRPRTRDEYRALGALEKVEFVRRELLRHALTCRQEGTKDTREEMNYRTLADVLKDVVEDLDADA